MLTIKKKRKEYKDGLDGVFGGLAAVDVITDVNAIYVFFYPAIGESHTWWGSLSLAVLYLTMRLFFMVADAVFRNDGSEPEAKAVNHGGTNAA